MNIPPESLATPFYQGSVQKLFAVPGRDDLMVCQTSSVGSVFDVGALFEIAGNDVSRAVFRHALYSSMARPETWVAVREAIVAEPGLDEAIRAQLLEGTLEDCLARGAKTHHVGMVDAVTGEVVTEGAPVNPSTLNVVRRFTIGKPPLVRLFHHPLYDYKAFQNADQFVVPLEVIVRFGLTSGSSVYRKYLGLGEKERRTYEIELGIGEPLEAWKRLGSPIVDFTSKYEPEDRPVSKQEAMLMSGLAAEQFVALGKLALLGAWAVRNLVESMGLRLWDLKWEFARSGDDLCFVDTIDTDSMRATGMVEWKGETFVIHHNKQAMRDYYRIIHGEWLDGVNAAKDESRKAGNPFVGLLREGQAEGRWPQDPKVHEEFLAIQMRKMELVKEGILGGRPMVEVATGLEACGKAELAFYEGLGKLAPLHALNGIASR